MWGIIGSLYLGLIPMIVDSPKEINAEWEERVLGIKYRITDLPHAVQEMTEGLVDDYFGKDFIKKIEEEIDKKPSGEYIEYWDNGTLKAKFPYKDRKAHGHLHAWYDNGRDAFKGHFKEGLKQGTHITFFHTEKGNNKQARLLRYNLNGELWGKQNRHYRSGNFWFVVNYEGGKVNGPLECWEDGKNQIMSADYKNGILKKNPPLPPGKRKRPKASEDEKLVNELINDVGYEIFRDFNVYPHGFGGSMPFDVESISLTVASLQRGTIEEGRRLIVALKERLADRVNQNEKLVPYLRNYPFTPLMAEIALSFCDKKGNDYKDGSIEHVFEGNGTIFYDAYSLENRKTEEVFREPYEEAVRIVREERMAKVVAK